MKDPMMQRCLSTLVALALVTLVSAINAGAADNIGEDELASFLGEAEFDGQSLTSTGFSLPSITRFWTGFNASVESES
jgi:hypothetical protein